MLKKIHSGDLYTVDEGWHVCKFHFTYEGFHSPNRDQFGVLLLLNEDIIHPGKGYDTHLHEDVEIVSYCVDGELVHRDGLGNKHSLQRGDVQYLCAGSGTTHSAHSGVSNGNLRFIQMRITPNKNGLTPRFSKNHYSGEARRNKLLHVISGENKNGAIRIHQDADIFVSEIEQGEQVTYEQPEDRQSYLVCLEGRLNVNGTELEHGDALEIWDEDQVVFQAPEDTHLLMVEIAKSG